MDVAMEDRTPATAYNMDSPSPQRSSNMTPEPSPTEPSNHHHNSSDHPSESSKSTTHNPASSQQFCLRWNNHQTSLLSTLPQLLDQSHLSDCTIVADGRKIRAHRLVLSGCSTFFSELFHTLESGIQQQCHPVIVLPPNTNFSSLAALITFMYSGEVNVYEDQISKLLELAETLGIKGLTEINNEHVNGIRNRNKSPSTPLHNNPPSSSTPPMPIKSSNLSPLLTPKPEQSPPSPFETSTNTPKLLSPPSFDAFFPRPHPAQFNFYPHHLLSLNQQPLNFSTTRSPFPMMPQSPLISPMNPQSPHNNLQTENRNFMEEVYKKERLLQECNKKLKINTNLKKIDRIAENLRYGANPSPPSSASPSSAKSFLDHFNQMTQKTSQMMTSPQGTYPISPLQSASAYLSESNKMSIKQQPMDNLMNYTTDQNKNKNQSTTSTGGATATKIPNSKLFAKCFICSKLLSNQYNLRVHLETHQNMRYACTVCSHVSRSKDALRKHISYRHPGTPSPCESESRRKRTKLASQIQQIQAQQMMKDQMAGNIIFPPSTPPTSSSNMPLNVDTNSNSASNQLALLQSFTSEMTIPSQTSIYHHHQQTQHQQLQQQQQQQQQSMIPHPTHIKTEINNNGEEQQHTLAGSINHLT